MPLEQFRASQAAKRPHRRTQPKGERRFLTREESDSILVAKLRSRVSWGTIAKGLGVTDSAVRDWAYCATRSLWINGRV